MSQAISNSVHGVSSADKARQMFASEPFNTARAKAKGWLLSAHAAGDQSLICYWQEVIIGLGHLRRERDKKKAR